MRQSLSKRQQSKANGKSSTSVVKPGSRTAEKRPKPIAAPLKSARKAIPSPARTTQIVSNGTASLRKPTPAAKTAKKAAPVKAAKPVKKATPKPVVKPVVKTVSKAAPKPAAPKKAASPKKPVAVRAAKSAPAKPASKATTGKATALSKPSAKPQKSPVAAAPVRPQPKAAPKPRSKASAKIHLPMVAPVPPIQPDPPRRHLSAAAMRAFEQAIKVFNRRQFHDAKEMFENLTAKFSNDLEIVARSQMYIQVCAQKVAHTNPLPRNADELYDRGVFALNIGDFTQARHFFEKALRINPEAPHLLYSLAATHAQVGAHAEALEYLQRSIQIQPRFRSQAYNDADFSELRENKQFLELLGLTSPFDLLESKR